MEVLGTIALGLLAGLLTTVAGLGGGLVLTLILAAFAGPQTALALAAPALLLGNIHRITLFRSDLDSRFAMPFVLGAVPGALVGGFLTLALPELVLHALIVLALGLAAAKEFKLIRFTPKASSVLPISFCVGVLTATSGGGGLLLGPLLLAAGARGGRFIASASLIAASVHLARLLAYGAGGLVTSSTLLMSVCIGIAIMVGNTLGKRVKISDAKRTRLTYVSLVACGAVTIAGLA
ncbi:MAG: TSUP family transporter [Polyangiales bacterium]